MKTFGGITATDNVTFSLPPGARHALIGPNGAGKTTFVNLLSGVLLPTSGKVFLNGQDVTEWSVRDRSRAGPRAHLPDQPALSGPDAASRAC